MLMKLILVIAIYGQSSRLYDVVNTCMYGMLKYCLMGWEGGEESAVRGHCSVIFCRNIKKKVHVRLRVCW